jgi:glutaredoxin
MHVLIYGILSGDGISATVNLVSKGYHVHGLINKSDNVSKLYEYVTTNPLVSIHYGNPSVKSDDIVQNIKSEYGCDDENFMILDYESEEEGSVQGPTRGYYTVYSKTGCVYCDKAKQLLSTQRKQYKYVLCDEFLFENREKFLNEIKLFTGAELKTFPLILDGDGDVIGGYTELESLFSNK